MTPFDVLVLTSPLLVALVLASGAALRDYAEARQFDDWWSAAVTLPGAFAGHVRTALRTPRAIAVRQRLDAAADDAVAIRLSVPSGEWDAHVANAFAADNPWVDALLVREGSSREANVRRRGDTSVHWTTPKTSFTLRVPRGERVRGFRELALSGKTVLESHLANSIPGELGLAAPFSALTPVYLNERYYGLFRAIEPIDESFLRRQGRMPGNIYRADTAERGEYFKDQPRNVFDNPYIWDRAAEGTDSEDVARIRLRRWIEAGHGPTLAHHRAFMDRVDVETAARLLASMLVAGDPYHMSGVHNQFWYDDPSSGLLTPLPWDLRLLDLEARATNPLNDFFTTALRSPFVMDRALTVAREAAEGGLMERLEARLAEATTRFAAHLEYERLRRELVSPPGEPDELRRVLRSNLETLATWAGDARVGFVETGDADSRMLDFETRGLAGADLVGFGGLDGTDVRLYLDRDGDGLRGVGDEPVSSRMTDGIVRLDEPLPLYAGWRHDGRHFSAGRIHYRLFAEGVPSGRSLRPILENRVTGEAVETEPIERGTALGDGIGFHPWEFVEPRGRTVRLSGEVAMTETLRVGPRDTLVVEPGTRLVLAPDVSIVSRGLVVAVGTPVRPISVLPADERLPWGTFALQGSGASGSRFAHTTFVRGGGATDGEIEYKGMVTIHRARDVRFSDATFLDNLRSDDGLNAVHSDVHIERCLFRNANGDAIDYDYSSGTIEGCSIEDSRNDAIDLMTSAPLIRSNRLLRSGDKGISIGEASHPAVIDNYIADGNRGIEIKDRSDPVLLHDTIERNEIGILSNVKNWRYAGGGRGLLALSRVAANQVEIEVDGESGISVIASPIGTDPVPPTSAPEWVHRAYGLVPVGRPGALGQAAVWTAPRPPQWVDEFGDEEIRFYEDAMAWDRTGPIRLREADGALSAEVEHGTGAWGRDVDWDLAAGGALVVELAGRHVVELTVVLAGPEGEATRTVEVSDEPGRIEIATVDVPPGRYDRLRFELDVDDGAVVYDETTGLVERRGGRVELFRVRLFAMGDEG
ncbi:MAG: CotH kinase family protein [Gemmatimonadota bacterium]|nr:CotH kinase family protein [Gemmatimonadota bacterium]